MPKLGDLTGTPWHIEKFTRAEGDERRHKSRCAYYRKEGSYCAKYLDRCHGSAHCEYYKERSKDDSIQEQHTSDKTTLPEKENPSSEVFFPIGTRVKHNRFGLGKVIDFDGRFVEVRFDEGQDKLLKLDAKLCHDNIILVRVVNDPEMFKRHP